MLSAEDTVCVVWFCVIEHCVCMHSAIVAVLTVEVSTVEVSTDKLLAVCRKFCTVAENAGIGRIFFGAELTTIFGIASCVHIVAGFLFSEDDCDLFI